MQNNQVRFDSRFTVSNSRGITDKRVARRTVTTIKSGKLAFGNPEMRAIFKGTK